MNNLELEIALEASVRDERAATSLVLKYLREAEKKITEIFPQEARPEKARPLSEDKVEIRFTVSREEFELFQKLMDRKAHANFERKYEKLFVALAKAEMRKIEGKQREDALPHGPGEVNSRYIPAVVKRAVWKRDQARRQFIAKDGHRCRETHGLQVDHIHHFAQDGPGTEANLRLLCGAHNRWRSRRV